MQNPASTSFVPKMLRHRLLSGLRRSAGMLVLLLGALLGPPAPAAPMRFEADDFSLELPAGWSRSDETDWILKHLFAAPDGTVRLKVGVAPADALPNLLAGFRNRSPEASGGPYVEGVASAGGISFATFTPEVDDGRDSVCWLGASKKFTYFIVAYDAKTDPGTRESLASFRLLSAGPTPAPKPPLQAPSSAAASSDSIWDAADRIGKWLKSVTGIVALFFGLCGILIRRGLRDTAYSPSAGLGEQTPENPPAPPQPGDFSSGA